MRKQRACVPGTSTCHAGLSAVANQECTGAKQKPGNESFQPKSRHLLAAEVGLALQTRVLGKRPLRNGVNSVSPDSARGASLLANRLLASGRLLSSGVVPL